MEVGTMVLTVPRTLYAALRAVLLDFREFRQGSRETVYPN
jgi:hypothetical protein